MISSSSIKPWYTSRTYWFNILSGALVLMAMPEVIAVLPPEWVEEIALINVIGNFVMRAITAGGVSLK